MSSPVEHIFSSAITSMSGQNNFYRFITDEQRQRILRGIVENYYAEMPNKIIFDTSRNWPAKLPALVHLFPEAKIICCVRDLVSIVNSFEHLVLNNPYSVSILYNWNSKITVYGRFETLMGPDGSVGRALNALKEAYYGPYRDRLIFVEYDHIVKNPLKTITSIYEEIGVAAFEHDFNAIGYEAPDFDTHLGFSDMHTVRSSVSPRARENILPVDIRRRLQGLEFWR